MATPDPRATLLEELASLSSAPLACATDPLLGDPAALRAHLAAQLVASDELRLASAAGLPGIVDSLRGLIRIVSVELEAVGGNALSAYDAAAALRDAADDGSGGTSAVAAAHASLVELIGAAADKKSSSFEVTLVELDGGLEVAIDACSAVDGALALLTDTELVAAHAPLCGRLHRMRAALAALPLHVPLTEATLRVAKVPPSQLHLIDSDDPLRALRARLVTAEVTAADVVIAADGRHGRAKPGGNATLPLVLTPDALARPGFDADAALASLRLRTHGAAHLLRSPSAGLSHCSASAPPQAELELLPVRVVELSMQSASPAAPAGVLLTVPVPVDAPEGGRLCVHSLTVAGEAVRVSGIDRSLTVRISSFDGIPTPQELRAPASYTYCISPCVTSFGALYVPSGSDLAIFDEAARARCPSKRHRQTSFALSPLMNRRARCSLRFGTAALRWSPLI